MRESSHFIDLFFIGKEASMSIWAYFWRKEWRWERERYYINIDEMNVIDKSQLDCWLAMSCCVSYPLIWWMCANYFRFWERCAIGNFFFSHFCLRVLRLFFLSACYYFHWWITFNRSIRESDVRVFTTKTMFFLLHYWPFFFVCL